MDFDNVHRENFSLYLKLFEENSYIPQYDDHSNLAMGFSSSSSPHEILNYHPILDVSSPPCLSFYDPFDPFEVFNYGKLNQEFSTIVQNGASHDHMHSTRSLGLDTTRFPFKMVDQYQNNEQKFENDSCLILDGDENRETNDFSKNKINKEILPSKRKRIIDKKLEIIKGQWTPDEDRLLMELVEKHGVRKWSSIAQMLPGRIGKQCRERWHNHLKPNIKKDRWSEEEDKILIEAHKQLGNKWAEIARSLPGRSENTIKNHWNATKRKQLSSSSARKNNSSSKPNTLLQNYIKSVISDDNYLENSSTSTGSISPSVTDPMTNIARERDIWCTNTEKEKIAAHESLLPSLDTSGEIHNMMMPFDLQNEIDFDFMQMISHGYI